MVDNWTNVWMGVWINGLKQAIIYREDCLALKADHQAE